MNLITFTRENALRRNKEAAFQVEQIARDGLLADQARYTTQLEHANRLETTLLAMLNTLNAPDVAESLRAMTSERIEHDIMNYLGTVHGAQHRLQHTLRLTQELIDSSEAMITRHGIALALAPPDEEIVIDTDDIKALVDRSMFTRRSIFMAEGKVPILEVIAGGMWMTLQKILPFANMGKTPLRIPLPDACIQINLADGATYISPVDENEAPHAFGNEVQAHPHILTGGKPCMGDFVGPYHEAVMSQDYSTMLSVLALFLQSCDPEDTAGAYWTRWLPIPDASHLSQTNTALMQHNYYVFLWNDDNTGDVQYATSATNEWPVAVQITKMEPILPEWLSTKADRDEDGYDRDGYDEDGYNRGGYDEYGYDRDGYDEYGYDCDGYDRYGYNEDGYNEDGYDHKGYDRYGYARDGYNEDGYNEDGYNEDGYNRDGYDCNGFDEDGYDCNGFDKDGYNEDGYDHEGYDREGYDEDGDDKDGYNENGYDRDGYARDGYNEDGYNRDGYDEDGYHRNGYDSDGYDRNGFDKDGYNRQGDYEVKALTEGSTA